jgi:polysaccharide export outer membrane protein
MRATSRKRFLTLVAALAAPCLTGLGCQYQMAWSVASPTAGTGLSAAVTTPTRKWNLALGSAHPQGPPPTVSREEGEDDRGTDFQSVPAPPGRIENPSYGRTTPAARPEEAVTSGDEEQPVVWRASSHGLTGEPAEDYGPILPLSWHDVRKPRNVPPLPENELPRELSKVALPPYRIEPPDVLRIEALRLVPRPPYRIEPLDEVVLRAPPNQVFPNEPIGGVYPVAPDGQVDLGYSYGKVSVAGLTLEQARAAVAKHIADLHGIKAPAITAALARARALPQIHGEHPVRMDGTVGLGAYGDVFVAGLTLAEARQAIEAQLERALVAPEVTVDVLVSSSKAYYVICDAGRCGQQVVKRPYLGGETVLDALSEAHGLPPGCTKRVWIARPVPGCVGCRQVLPVDWAAISQGAATGTNYQLFPGDRVYVKADRWAALETGVEKVLAPFEWLCGGTP